MGGTRVHLCAPPKAHRRRDGARSRALLGPDAILLIVYTNAIESLNARYRLEGRHPIVSAARSPILTAVACVLPRTISGMIDASAMWRPHIP